MKIAKSFAKVSLIVTLVAGIVFGTNQLIEVQSRAESRAKALRSLSTSADEVWKSMALAVMPEI